MMTDFTDLEQLAQATLDSSTTDALSRQADDYTVASLEELLDLLEMAVEPYNQIKSTLPQELKQSAQDEIAFFRDLVKAHLGQWFQNTPLYGASYRAS